MLAALMLFFLAWFSRSVPQNGFFSSFCAVARLMLLDFFGVLSRVVVVRDFLYSIGGVLTDRPVGVLGVLKLDGADCFLVRGAGDFLSSGLRGNVNADLRVRAEAGLVGVDVRRTSCRGELFPLLALLEARVPSLASTGESFPLREEALESTGETVPATESLREVLLLAGDSVCWRGMGESLRMSWSDVTLGAGVGEGEEGGSGTRERLPGVTRRTWQGSWRDRKCSSVSQPPPTRTIMCRPFSSCGKI